MAKVVDVSLARRLRQAIEHRPMSQTDVAKQLGLSGAAVSQWLSGAKQPNRENIKSISELLGVDPQWLEYGSGTGPQTDPENDRAEYQADTCWRMRTAPVDGGRDYGNSIIETFDPDLVTMVREGIQNTLDQVYDSAARVVFRVIRLRGNDLRKYLKALKWNDLKVHLDAASQVRQRHGRLLKAALEEFDRAEELVLLVYEESGTTGLIGEEYGEGNYAALTRNNLDSTKNRATAGGLYGLGKGTWWRTSQYFMVLFNSDLYEPTAEGKQDTRIIGRCEFPWHEHGGSAPCAGPGWFGRKRLKDGVEVAESFWGNATLADDLYIGRHPDIGPGTTICVVGFHDPSSEEVKDPRALANDIETAVSDYFWPAIAEKRLEVRIETWDGKTLRTQVQVDVGSRQPALVEALVKLRAQDVQDRLRCSGDVVRRDVTLSVPRRTAGDSSHAQFTHKAILVVRRATEEDENKWLGHLALFRGPRMVVEYQSLRNMFSGAVPFHSALLCGEALSDKPDAQDARADRFLRTAEPPSHTKWIMTPDLKADYARGSKSAIDEMLKAASREVAELVRPPADNLDDGPIALKELLNIGVDPPPPPDRPRVFRPTATLDTNGRWVVDARIRVRPDDQTCWKVLPVVVFDVETGGGQPVDWAELEALNGCSLEEGKLLIPAGINEARFRGITDPDSHPIAATESCIRIELRRVERS